MIRQSEPYPENFVQVVTDLMCTTFEESREEFFTRMRIFKKQKIK